MAQPNLNVPLTLSYDQRGVASYTNLQAGKDQVRKNCHYEITRTAVDTTPDIALARRPGVTAKTATYGATAQVQYLVARDPASTWEPTPWVIVKNSNDNKIVTDATAVTLLSDADYYPRFWDVTDVSGTNYLIVQLQNSTNPAATPAQKTYYGSSINGMTAISDADYTGLSQRGKMEAMDGYLFFMDSRNRIYQFDVNTLNTLVSTNYITMSNTQSPAQSIIKCRSQILGFTTDYCEAFRNEGNATGSVLSRVPNTEHRIGLASVAGGGDSIAGKTHFYVTIGDLVFFLGRYGGSKYDTSLVAYDGNRFEKVSRPYEDTLLSTATVYSVNRVTFGGKVAVGIQMTAPTATTQSWMMFFPDINEFFLWDSTVFGPVNNGLQYAGATNTVKLYEFGNTDVFQDASTSFDMIAQFRLPVSSLDWKSMAMCGLIADTPGSSQTVSVATSDDDCGSFVTRGTIDLANKRKELQRLGTFRERFVKLTHSGTGEVRLRRFYASLL